MPALLSRRGTGAGRLLRMQMRDGRFLHAGQEVDGNAETAVSWSVEPPLNIRLIRSLEVQLDPLDHPLVVGCSTSQNSSTA